MKFKINQISKLVFLTFLINISYAHSHNFFNGSCNDHCEKSIESKTNERELINLDNKKQMDNKYSCLKKSLCRG